MANKRLIDPAKVVAQELARRQPPKPVPSSWTADLPDVAPDEPAANVTIDPWEPHGFDGGPLGDFRCVGCGLSKAVPIHVQTCQEKVWDGPYSFTCGRVLDAEGRCQRHWSPAHIAATSDPSVSTPQGQ